MVLLAQRVICGIVGGLTVFLVAVILSYASLSKVDDFFLWASVIAVALFSAIVAALFARKYTKTTCAGLLWIAITLLLVLTTAQRLVQVSRSNLIATVLPVLWIVAFSVLSIAVGSIYLFHKETLNHE